MGIEPTLEAWEAAVLPLNYTRTFHYCRHTAAKRISAAGLIAVSGTARKVAKRGL